MAVLKQGESIVRVIVNPGGMISITSDIHGEGSAILISPEDVPALCDALKRAGESSKARVYMMGRQENA
jgi:hypothetical protein